MSGWDDFDIDLTAEEAAEVADWGRGGDERPDAPPPPPPPSPPAMPQRDAAVAGPSTAPPERLNRPLTDIERLIRETLELGGYTTDPCKP